MGPQDNGPTEFLLKAVVAPHGLFLQLHEDFVPPGGSIADKTDPAEPMENEG